MHFHYIAINFPMKKAYSFIWTKLNSLHQGCLVLSLVEIFSVFWRRRCKYLLWIFLILIFSPFGKGNGPLSEKILNPSIHECPVPGLVDIISLVSENKSLWTLEWIKTLEQTCLSHSLTLPYNCYAFVPLIDTTLSLLCVCSIHWHYLITAMHLFHSLTLPYNCYAFVPVVDPVFHFLPACIS